MSQGLYSAVMIATFILVAAGIISALRGLYLAGYEQGYEAAKIEGDIE